MKRLIKFPLRMLWRLTAPVRRPLVRKVEALLARAVARAPVPAPHVHVACECRVNAEAGLLMDYMVRELVRVQTRLDHLQEAVEGLAPAPHGLSVVGAGDVEDEPERSAAG